MKLNWTYKIYRINIENRLNLANFCRISHGKIYKIAQIKENMLQKISGIFGEFVSGILGNNSQEIPDPLLVLTLEGIRPPLAPEPGLAQFRDCGFSVICAWV